MAQPGPAVVLVHGAWHAPWHWHEVVHRLAHRAAVDTVDLPSCSTEPGDLHDDADAIRATLDRYENVLLVAHSYGGIPVTEAATGHPSVRGIVFVAAFMADLGESMGSFDGSGELNVHPETDCAVGPVDGTMVMKPDRAIDLLYHDCPRPEMATAHLRSMAFAPIGQSPDSVAWKEIPSSFVMTTDDRAMPVDFQRRLSRRAGRVFEIGTGHSPFLARPAEFCGLVDTIRCSL